MQLNIAIPPFNYVLLNDGLALKKDAGIPLRIFKLLLNDREGSLKIMLQVRLKAVECT